MEMALIKFFNDLQEWDGGSATILALLDLSATFDTTDHAILIERLGGVGSGRVPCCAGSLLCGHSQN